MKDNKGAAAKKLNLQDEPSDIEQTQSSTSLELRSSHFKLEITREMSIEEHNTCCLCGTDLNFKHAVDHLSLSVKEDADCPSCLIKMRERTHKLH